MSAILPNGEKNPKKLPKWRGLRSAELNIILHTLENVDTNTTQIIHTDNGTIKTIQDHKTQNALIQNSTNHLSRHSQPTPDITDETRTSAMLTSELKASKHQTP